MKPNITEEELKQLLDEESKSSVYDMIENGTLSPRLIVFSELKYDKTRKRSVCDFQDTKEKDYIETIRKFARHVKRDKMREGLNPAVVMFTHIASGTIATCALTANRFVGMTTAEVFKGDKGYEPYGDVLSALGTEKSMKIPELGYARVFYAQYYN